MYFYKTFLAFQSPEVLSPVTSGFCVVVSDECFPIVEGLQPEFPVNFITL